MKSFYLFIFYLCLNYIKNILLEHNEENIRGKILNSFLNSSKKELFKVYHLIYQKNYDLKSEEGVKRYKIFKQSLKLIQETNAENLSYKLGLNQFADLTNDEYKQLLNFTPNNETIELINNEEQTFLPQQTNIDWTSKMGPVKDQGTCGSCWAFATVDVLEGNYNLNYNVLKSYSQQYLIDCVKSNSGCNGGSAVDAYNYITLNGIVDGTVYPYDGIQHTTCANFTSKNYLIKNLEYYEGSSGSKAKVLASLAKGPVVTVVDASSSNFQLYSSGILPGSPCKSPNHAVSLVGYTQNSTSEVFKIKNSWTTDWGEAGYGRISISTTGDSYCISNYTYYPTVTKISNTSPQMCLKLFPQCSYSGSAYEVCDSMVTFPNFTGQVASISNILKSPVFLFTGGSCTGSSFSINSDFPCLSSSSSTSILVNNIKSIAYANNDTPTLGCIKVYDTACAASIVKAEICASNPDLSAIGWGLKISSLRMNKSRFRSITLFTGKNYSGNGLTISASAFSIPSTYDKKTVSIRFNP
jgi:C1A family cysteine protease